MKHGITCACFLQGCMSIVSTVSRLKPEALQENIDDLSSAEDDNSDKSSMDDSSVGDNLYQLTGNGDNVSDDEMLMTDVESVFYIDFLMTTEAKFDDIVHNSSVI